MSGSASELFDDSESQQFAYWDRSCFDTFERQLEARTSSATVYVGNLSFFTAEERLQAVMSTAGDVRHVIMGINKHTRTPCGFAFVVYETPEEARGAVAYLNGTHCDGRVIKVELDAGFEEGRQYGRAKSGGQPRDDYHHDPERIGPMAVVAAAAEPDIAPKNIQATTFT